jgi:hypothetical protein
MPDTDKSTGTRLQATSDAGTEDLREYVESMRVENVANALGDGAKSNLASNIVVATLVITVLLLLATLGPHMLSNKETTVKPAAPTTETNGGTSAADPNANAATPTSTDPANPDSANANPAAPTDAEAARAAAALGIDETKEADPNKNPLDNLDNLLDGAK